MGTEAPDAVTGDVRIIFKSENDVGLRARLYYQPDRNGLAILETGTGKCQVRYR